MPLPSKIRALGLATALISLPALASATQIETAQGPVDVTSAERVVVMDVPAIDSLTALGVPIAGAPNRLYVSYLDEVGKATPDVGTLFEPDLEAMATLQPDLIILGGRTVAEKASLERVAPAIDMSIGPDVLADTKARMTAYGELFGKQDKAAELNAALDAKIAKLAEVAKGQGTALIVLTNGTKMSAYGKGSRFGWIFDATGMEEAAKGVKVETHGSSISHEFIGQADPDWLFVVDRGAAVGEVGNSAEATLKSPLVAETTAWKTGQVVFLEPTNVYIAGGGYTAMSDTIDQLIEAFSR